VVKKIWLETLWRQEKQENVKRNVKDSSEMLTPEVFQKRFPEKEKAALKTTWNK